MGRPSLRIPGEGGDEREGERVQVSLPCKAWERVSEQDKALETIEGHSPVAFSSPCAEEKPPGSGR